MLVAFSLLFILWGSSPTRLACGVLTVTKGYRLGFVETTVPPSPRDRFPQRSWYQDLGTKKKNGELERQSLSVCRRARGAAGSLPGGSGGLEASRNSRGSGGRQPPSKNNFVEPEPTFNHLQLPTNFRPPSTTFNRPPSTTFNFRPTSDHLQPPSTDHPCITIFREKVKPITTPPDKVFERPS